MVHTFTFVSWYNIGYIDWEPWLPKVNFFLILLIYKEFYLLDIHTYTQKLFTSSCKCTSNNTSPKLFYIEYCDMDCCHDG